MGMSEETFWHSNPRIMKPYIKAYKLKMKHYDEVAWLFGSYTVEALLSTVGNMFGKKSSKKAEYPEKPRMSDTNVLEESKAQNGLSQKEIMDRTNLFFASLKVMQANFESSH